MLSVAALAVFPVRVQGGDISLGSAANFAVLAEMAVSNTGSTIISGGNVGVDTVNAISGFPPGSVTAPYTTIGPGSVVTAAMSDLSSAYMAAAALPYTGDLTGQNLGGLELTPGVYFFSSTAQLTGTLILNDEGDANAQFVFQIGSALTTAANAVVETTGTLGDDTDIFWQLGTSATLGADNSFEGNILAGASVTLGAGTSIEDGSAMALTGAVTLDDNMISSVPEPATITLAVIASALLGLPALRKKWLERRSRG
jgi:hypothetical protein